MIIFDDKIAINMFLDESLNAPLPDFADQALQNEKNPTPTIGQDEVLVSTPSVSQGRLIWGGWGDEVRTCLTSTAAEELLKPPNNLKPVMVDFARNQALSNNADRRKRR